MWNNGRLIIYLICAWVCCACEGTSFQSSVPTYPVRVVIDTKMGPFVHFVPTAVNSYITVTKDGYFYNGNYVLPVSVTDAWGYGGILVYIDMLSNYNAFDLACPACAKQGRKSVCTIDGIFANCPDCGEEYDLGSGTAVPQKGIAKEMLRRYNIMPSDGKLTITQR